MIITHYINIFEFESMTDKISISFDEDNKIRVLEADKFKETDTMRSESMEFMKSIYIK